MTLEDLYKITMPGQTFQELRAWRDNRINEVKSDHQQLNSFHDDLMSKVVLIALHRLESEWGSPPTHFAFILMGSAGRYEQSIWSDQDHGIIYDGNHLDLQYFLRLGEEIVEGLSICGYELCDGKVMASNRIWCKSYDDWNNQMKDWLHDSSWEALRNFSIFFDSRVLIGNQEYLNELKKSGFEMMKQHPTILIRLVDNVQYIKKGVGLFGQLLPERHGIYKGRLNLKQVVLFPFVNAGRLLSYSEEVFEPATLTRFHILKNHFETLNLSYYEEKFYEAINYRLQVNQDVLNYRDIHYIRTSQLSKEDRKQIQGWIKDGSSLMKKTSYLLRELNKEGKV